MFRKPEGYETFRTVSELATYCGVTARTIKRWNAAGLIPKPYKTDADMNLWSPEACNSVLAMRISTLPSEVAKSRRIT